MSAPGQMEAQKKWLTDRGFIEGESGDYTRGNAVVGPVGARWRAIVAGWVVDGPTPADALAGAADEAEASYIQHLHDVREARTILEETPKPPPKMPAWWPTGFYLPNNARPAGT